MFSSTNRPTSLTTYKYEDYLKVNHFFYFFFMKKRMADVKKKLVIFKIYFIMEKE